MLLQPFVSNVLLFMYEWWRNSYTLHNSKPYRYLWDIFFGTTTLLCVTLLSHFLFFHCTLHLSSTLKCTGLRWPVFLPCATLACKVVIFLGKLSLKTGFKLNPPVFLICTNSLCWSEYWWLDLLHLFLLAILTTRSVLVTYWKQHFYRLTFLPK